MTNKVLLYTGLLGDGINPESNPIIWITIDGKAFLGCPHRCAEPLKFSEPNVLRCPKCDWETTTEFARQVLAGALGHLLALYAMIGRWDPVGSIREILEGQVRTGIDG